MQLSNFDAFFTNFATELIHAVFVSRSAWEWTVETAKF